MTLDRDPVALEDDQVYATVGIYSYGRGLFARPPIAGKDTSYSTYYRLRCGQLVYSKLFAWEGALAVVDERSAGMFVSQEFPTFTIDRALVTPEYLALLCSWRETWARVRMGETGMGGRRKRVHPDRLLEVQLPFPSLAEQRRIVDLIAALDACRFAAAHTTFALKDLAKRLRAGHFAAAAGPACPAGEFFEITMGRQRSPRHATGTHMVPYLRAANAKDGRLNLTDVKRMNFTPAEQAKFALRSGDVLVSEGCGSLDQLGATAQWNAELNGVVCFQNTLLRVRPRPGTSTSGYAYQWARFCFEAGRFAAIASGTNIFHIGAERAVEIPVAAIGLGAQHAVTETIAAVDQAAEKARAEEDAADTLRTALLTSLLSGEHEIPNSYDVLLEST